MSRHLLGTVFVLVVLLGFLGVSVWFMITAWNSIEGPMGVHQWIAMFLGVFFSCLVGFGLMGMIFYSSRKGYDEPPTFVQQDDDSLDRVKPNSPTDGSGTDLEAKTVHVGSTRE